MLDSYRHRAKLHVYDFEPEMFLRDWAEVTYYYEYPFGKLLELSPVFCGSTNWLIRTR